MAGRLVVNTGSMFSGKSSELLKQGERHSLAGRRVVYIKSAIDDRYKVGKINTHNGKSYEAIKIGVSSSIITAETLEADVVLIDEIQFFNLEVIDDIQYLVSAGKFVYVSGLDMNFKGEPFKTTSYLMSIADDVNKFKAVCVNCGSDAYVSAKKPTADKGTVIDVGSYDKYLPLCRKCFAEWQNK